MAGGGKRGGEGRRYESGRSGSPGFPRPAGAGPSVFPEQRRDKGGSGEKDLFPETGNTKCGRSPLPLPDSHRVGPITEMESVSINRTAARLVAGQGMTQSARTPASLGTLRKARSQIEPGIWRGKAWHGRAGQAFALVESGVVDRATANSSPRTATGHKQDDQAAKTKPPAGSCSRILDQSLGPTRARSSRNRPLE